MPATNVQELIAYAKQHPDKLSYASSGNGASSHLAGILFNQMAGTQIMHIPYKGTGPALNDLLGGQVSMSFTDILTALPTSRPASCAPSAWPARSARTRCPTCPPFRNRG